MMNNNNHNQNASEPSNMEYLNLLSRMGGCIDRLVTALGKLCARIKSSHPQRVDHTKRVRMRFFKESLARCERDWSEASKSLFYLIGSNDIYTTQAQDTMSRLKIFSQKHIQLKNKLFDDDCYGMVIEILTKPILRMIMEEREVSKETRTIQDRRRYFMLQLLLACVEDPPPAPRNQNESPHGSELIVVDDYPSTSQDRNSQTNGRFANQRQNSMARDCTREGRLIVASLTRALGIHSEAVSDDSSEEILRRKFHIVNISYVTDIMKDYLLDLRERLTRERQIGNRINIPRALPECKRMLEDLSNNLANDLELVDFDTTMVIFRHDLKILSFQVQLLIQMTKSC